MSSRKIVNKGGTKEARQASIAGSEYSSLPNIKAETRKIMEFYTGVNDKPPSTSCLLTVRTIQLIKERKSRKDITSEIESLNSVQLKKVANVGPRVSVGYQLFYLITLIVGLAEKLKEKQLHPVFKFRRLGEVNIRKGQPAARDYVLSIDKIGVLQGHQPERCDATHIVPVPYGLQVILLEKEPHFLNDKYPEISYFEPDPNNDGRTLYRYNGLDEDLKALNGMPLRIDPERAKAINKEIREYTKKKLDRSLLNVLNSSKSQGGGANESTNFGRIAEFSESTRRIRE